jgi:RNA polymerase sigma factor (sigma-70 family)
VPDDVEDLLRELAPQVLGVVARRYADFAAAEDAVQEALLVAAERWPDAGVPEQPLGWLITTASRRLIDAARSDAARRDRESRTARADVSPDAADRDDSLVLLLMCCHPALTPASAIALTLRAVGGLTTAEIARAFLVPEATMAQRISRAKRTVADSGARFELPGRDELPERLRSALHVLYLVFNEGYVGSSGSAVTRTDLSAEAIRLTRMVRTAVPDDDEIAGLLAMMLLLDARRAGPGPLGPRPRRRGSRAARRQGRAGGGVPAAGADRRGPRPGDHRGSDRLAEHPGALHPARGAHRQPGRRAQPGSGGRDGRRPGGRAGHGRRGGRADG